MDEKALLDAIRQIVKEEASPINGRLDSMEKRIDSMETKLDATRQDITEIKENLDEVRGAQNYLIEWVDNLSRAVKGNQ